MWVYRFLLLFKETLKEVQCFLLRMLQNQKHIWKRKHLFYEIYFSDDFWVCPELTLEPWQYHTEEINQNEWRVMLRPGGARYRGDITVFANPNVFQQDLNFANISIHDICRPATKNFQWISGGKLHSAGLYACARLRDWPLLLFNCFFIKDHIEDTTLICSKILVTFSELQILRGRTTGWDQEICSTHRSQHQLASLYIACRKIPNSPKEKQDKNEHSSWTVLCLSLLRR